MGGGAKQKKNLKDARCSGIVGWLLSNKPDELKDLGNFLRNLFDSQDATQMRRLELSSSFSFFGGV
jgi:hypothetical protein